MRSVKSLVGLLVAACIASCSGGGSGSGGSFRLIEFLESGKDNIPRNRTLTFDFSGPVLSVQDFFERLKIENVQTGVGQSNFARAVGAYVVTANRVTFTPRLPNLEDRGDAGFRGDGNYVVFLKGGPDALQSTDGNGITTSQEFVFDTNEFFEDTDPTSPPRVFGLVALDSTSGATIDMGRLDPRPPEVALIDNEDLILNGRVIEPGAGGAPSFSTRWRFELTVSEAIDPATVTPSNIEMFEIFADATTSGPTAPGASAPPDYFGTAVNFKVPIVVETDQGLDATGAQSIKIVVTPLITLVDDTRYRLTFAGNILGIDFRQAFIGENGLTGDGTTVLSGVGQPFTEPGGLGYTTEFIVRDRPAINAQRTLTYDPLADGIQPELGQTTPDEDRWNSALYNPASDPSTAVGFLSAFGQGTDGDLAVSGAGVTIIDTGDTLNDLLGNPFVVNDLNANDNQLQNTLPGDLLLWDSVEHSELQLSSLTVSSSSTLLIIGVNPLLLRVRGLVQINGVIDMSGGDGGPAGTGVAAGGFGGVAGFPGGSARRPNASCSILQSGCAPYLSYLNSCGGNQATFPHQDHGSGPGRGYAGGEGYGYVSGAYSSRNHQPGTGGGGGSHATAGTAGEDRISATSATGSDGRCHGGTFSMRNSGIVGIRGQPGAVYGDREVFYTTWGGASGAAGGSTATYASFTPGKSAGGAGGGGGGSLTVVASGPILAAGGVIDATGGNGGDGAFQNWNNSSSNTVIQGAGGAGAGGAIVLISGDDINLTAALLDARGGVGGAAANRSGCTVCNAGGDGGRGFIFLMDADGQISGLNPGTPGNYDNFSGGVLTISEFNADRFSSIAAVTVLYNVGAADPAFLSLAPTDILGNVNTGQRIRIYASSAQGDLDEPLLPDSATETGAIEVALVKFLGGATTVEILGDMAALNTPNRDAFLRFDARFEYDEPVEAALGPFASIDQIDASFTFNG